MKSDYFVLNLKNLLEEERLIEAVQRYIDSYSSPKNPEVENFLKKSAINFTKLNQSVTYLVFNKRNGDFVGYFSLALKSVIISADKLSNTSIKRLKRISVLESASNTFTVAAYLIAQLGKNYSIGKDSQINGTELLSIAYDQIYDGQKRFGGVMAFLECEDNDFLIEFYENKNHLSEFGVRDSKNVFDNSDMKLHQFLKFL